MTIEKLTLGKIDYINASPVYYGLDNGLLPDWIEMIEGPPAVLNAMISRGELAMSPVSSAYYGLNHKDLLILPDLSISCHDRVLSVILMSNYPLKDLDGRQVVLTEDSATAKNLVRLILARNRVKPEFSTRRLRSLGDVPDNADAALIIGDAALTRNWEERFSIRMDLGEVWHQMTGLPFVFALWVVRRSFALDHPGTVKAALELFYRSRTRGYDHLDQVIRAGAAKLFLPEPRIREYYACLFCDLDGMKVTALDRFFSSLYQEKIFADPVKLEFFRI
ncbi:MAG: menaquinone biosynthesis protein [Pseudomonadota bacterium]